MTDDICEGWIVKIKAGMCFWKRKNGDYYWPLHTAVFRVFRVEGNNLWIESLDGKAERCINRADLKALSPLEQLALQVKDD